MVEKQKQFGLQLTDYMGWFGGRHIVPIDQKKPPYWRRNFPMKQIMFSASHLSIHTVDYYYEEIKKRKLKWLHGYPSQLAFFATLIKEKGLPPISMDYITTGAENLLSHQTSIILEVFGVRPLQHYGLAEGVANISQIPNGDLQVDQDFAFVEFIKTNFDSNLFRIIGTNYSNIAFPLIRYDTNDLIRLNDDGEVISIDGRNEDFIVLPSGVKLGRLDHIFKTSTFIKEAQIYQPSLRVIILNIVQSNAYHKKIHEKMILNECRKRFGKEIEIRINYVDRIKRTKSGKLKFVISEIDQ